MKLKNLTYLFMAMLVFASCSTVKRNGYVQTRRYKEKAVTHKHKQKKEQKTYAFALKQKQLEQTLTVREDALNTLETRSTSAPEMTAVAPIKTNTVKMESAQAEAPVAQVSETPAASKAQVFAPMKNFKRALKKEHNKSDVKVKSKKSSPSSGGKSQLVALLLCIFVGTLGIHRFYLGYPVIGVIQLLTLGGFGVWTLIDLIMIITGDLEPKNGGYDETL